MKTLDFELKGKGIYDLLIENGYDENEFNVTLESEYNENEFNDYCIEYNENLYDEDEIIKLLKNEFGNNVIFIL